MSEKKVIEIDSVMIYADNNGYFIKERYLGCAEWYSLKTYLGKTAKEVEQSLSDNCDWNYRAWHGEMDAILKAQKAVRNLPNIR